MLNLIADFRSGTRLELVIPVLNEESRIGTVIECYRPYFDIVLLDGGSSDKTLEVAREFEVTVYKRDAGPIYTEEYFAYYANHSTKSGHTFYLFADEFFETTELLKLYEDLKKGSIVIVGRRVDWCYGYKIRWMNSCLPRGFSKGEAIFRPDNLHQGLTQIPNVEFRYITIQHLQVWDMRRFLGQCGGYASVEIERFYSQKNSFLKFLRRFFLFELLSLPKRLWSQRKASLAFQFWQVLVAFVVPIVGLLCLIEQKFLLAPADQLAFYKTFYDRK